jgi:hypothetical protein
MNSPTSAANLFALLPSLARFHFVTGSRNNPCHFGSIGLDPGQKNLVRWAKFLSGMVIPALWKRALLRTRSEGKHNSWASIMA